MGSKFVQFSREEFEAGLPVSNKTGNPLWECLGYVGSELCYYVPLIRSPHTGVYVRSSIDQTGYAAECGEDSIRTWLVQRDGDGFRPLGTKAQRWITRTSGWQIRLKRDIKTLLQWRLYSGDCTMCGQPKGVYKVKKEGPNKDRPFAKCREHGQFQWVDKAVEKKIPGYFAPAETKEVAVVETQTSTVLPPVIEENVAPTYRADRTPNEAQRTAIESPASGAIRVLAGPGAGKTFLIEERVAALVGAGVPTGSITAVTFSRSMADEMAERIGHRAHDMADSQWITTIHALCLRIQRDEGLLVDVPKPWELKKWIEEISETEYPEAEARPGWQELYAWVVAPMSKCLTTSEDLGFFVERLGAYHGHKVHNTRRRLEAKLKDERKIIFPQMLMGVELRLGRDSSFRNRWQQKFSHVVCDEGQDTTAQAMRILTVLAAPQDNFTIVGDTDQLLYRFAGATPEANLFAGFETRYPDALTVKLETNYRSTHAIVDACRELIRFNYDDMGGPYEQRYFKKLAPREDAEQGRPVTFTMYEDQNEEGASVVDLMTKEFSAEDPAYGPGDVFVGMRTRAQAAYLEGHLLRAKIPYINANGGSFWQSRHVADILSYFALIVDPSNSAAFKRCYRIASNWMVAPWGINKGKYITHRYLGASFLAACGNDYRNVNQAVSKRRGWRPGGEDLIMLVEGGVDLLEEISEDSAKGPDTLIQYILDDCYIKYLKAAEGITSDDAANDGKLDDLETVKAIAAGFKTCEEFLDYVKQIIVAAEQAKEKDWTGHVVLATVHRLKGLERKWVIGIGWCEGQNRKTQQPVGYLPHTYALTTPPQQGILPTGGMNRVEDERCIAYVVISRAKERCDLTGFYAGRPYEVLGPTRFAYEAGLLVPDEPENEGSHNPLSRSDPEPENAREVTETTEENVQCPLCGTPMIGQVAGEDDRYPGRRYRTCPRHPDLRVWRTEEEPT